MSDQTNSDSEQSLLGLSHQNPAPQWKRLYHKATFAALWQVISLLAERTK